MPEPWLRETLTHIPAVPRQILHALELAAEDYARFCSPLTESELNTGPFGLPSVAFQVRHMVRSLDRLLTYAEGNALSNSQLEALATEQDPAPSEQLYSELLTGMLAAARRIEDIPTESYTLTSHVGRQRIPSTVGGLLIHCAEHTQRHSGQMVTTAKLLLAIRAEARTSQ
jgi:uncharacterized damage-inducible protein DinB